MKRSNRKSVELAVKAATDNPGMWCGDGRHKMLIECVDDCYILSANGYGFDTPDQAIEALTEAWQAEDARRRQSARNAALDSVAQVAGFVSWRQLETAAKNGQQIVINEEVQG